MPATTEQKTELAHRPPVVVVVGHIDHGKTTLLDAIRETKVAEREAGGITQAIGAYQAEHGGRKITFIDTPGHEAFSAMRARGAHVADVAVLVVAADEGVKPQTEEAIRIIQQFELPFVVAMNKMDKPGADPNRVKGELAERSILVEGYGGTVPVAEISAKDRTGLDHLLETILLLAELEEPTWHPDAPGAGVVIESHLDPKRGAAATLLIEDGAVRQGDSIVIGDQATPIRIFENYRGESATEAAASEPVRIVGFKSVPKLGEPFRVYRDRKEAEAAAAAAKAGATVPAASAGPAPATSSGQISETPKTVVNLIIKADTLGSKEALEAMLEKIGSAELGHKILKSEAGEVNESDVKLAQASKNAFIVAFRAKIPAAIRDQAERGGVTIVSSDIIYELLDAVKQAMIALAPAQLRRVDLGTARVIALFKEERGRQIIGGRVEEGSVRKSAAFEIIRNQRVIGRGKIMQLQSQRRDVDEVAAGSEFGIMADADLSLAAGDTLKTYTEERVTPTL
ncbi:translation initiation factor IF-2 [Candidatus Parcubacteria bacterium]|nr:MAG: translation initiation factor IF-2 [Candidatus Parcubacteria bacterium]